MPLALLFTLALTAQDPSTPPLALRTNRALARGIAWLRTQQKPDGTFPGHENDHPGGITAFVCYTLLKSGVSRTDPLLFSALRSIENAEFKTTYSAAVRLMLLEALGDAKATAAHARQPFDYLIASQAQGVWGGPNEPIDMSNTQFALLGLRAGKQLGFEVPEKTLDRCASALLRWQDTTGGFEYHTDQQPTAGMTAATLAGFAVIAQLSKGYASVESTLAKHKNEIRAGEAWLEERWMPDKNAHGARAWTPTFHYAHLWAVERYCGLTAKAKLGDHDWYREGAEYLVADQRADGGWGRNVEEQCFAMLFLRRATVTSYEDLSAIYAAIDRDKKTAEEKPTVHAAGNVPRITDWLIAGPFTDKRDAPLLAKPPFAPEKLVPREKQQLRERTFERWTLKADGWTDLEALTKRGGDFLLWVLATNVIYKPTADSDKPALDAILWLTLEDGWKVYFDGKLVSADDRVAAPIEETVRVDLRLEPGVHTLVVLVSDDVGASAFGARLSDAQGKVLTSSVIVSADPTGRTRPPEHIEKPKK
jgi:hypothetical protein